MRGEGGVVVPWGVSSQTHLKELYFTERRGKQRKGQGRLFRRECRGPDGGPGEPRLTLPRVTLPPAPRQTAYYPTCRKVIAPAERKGVEVFKCFVWRHLKGQRGRGGGE
jgi:hypothetical protein